MQLDAFEGTYAMTLPAESSEMSSRVPAFIAGALVPLGLVATAIVIALMIASQSGAPFRQAGPAATTILIIPGIFLIGSLFAFPIAGALVSFMAWLMRRTRYADHLLAWTLAGPLFALPAALALWSFDVSHAFPFGFLSGELLGMIGGITAGLKRPRFDQP